jgi:hypothetical protein
MSKKLASSLSKNGLVKTAEYVNSSPEGGDITFCSVNSFLKDVMWPMVKKSEKDAGALRIVADILPHFFYNELIPEYVNPVNFKVAAPKSNLNKYASMVEELVLEGPFPERLVKVAAYVPEGQSNIGINVTKDGKSRDVSILWVPESWYSDFVGEDFSRDKLRKADVAVEGMVRLAAPDASGQLSLFTEDPRIPGGYRANTGQAMGAYKPGAGGGVINDVMPGSGGAQSLKQRLQQGLGQAWDWTKQKGQQILDFGKNKWQAVKGPGAGAPAATPPAPGTPATGGAGGPGKLKSILNEIVTKVKANPKAASGVGGFALGALGNEAVEQYANANGLQPSEVQWLKAGVATALGGGSAAMGNIPAMIGTQLGAYTDEAGHTLGDISRANANKAQATSMENMVGQVGNLKQQVAGIDALINQARATGDATKLQQLQQQKLALMRQGQETRQQFYGESGKGYGAGAAPNISQYQTEYGLQAPTVPAPQAPVSTSAGSPTRNYMR